MKVVILFLLIFSVNLYPAFTQNENGGMIFDGSEVIRGELVMEWVEGDYIYPNDGEYYREVDFYIIPYKEYWSKLPGVTAYSYGEDENGNSIKVFTKDGDFKPTYDDGRIFVSFKKEIFPEIPDHFFEYEGGRVSIPIELTLTNYLIEVYPGGGEYFEQSASIKDYKYIDSSKKLLKMKSYKEADYPLLKYKSKDDYINIIDKENGQVIYKVYKNTFKLGDLKLLQSNIYESDWYKIIYLDKNKKDYFLGFVHKSQVEL